MRLVKLMVEPQDDDLPEAIISAAPRRRLAEDGCYPGQPHAPDVAVHPVTREMSIYCKDCGNVLL